MRIEEIGNNFVVTFVLYTKLNCRHRYVTNVSCLYKAFPATSDATFYKKSLLHLARSIFSIMSSPIKLIK